MYKADFASSGYFQAVISSFQHRSRSPFAAGTQRIVERMEPRMLMSVFVVTNTGDNGGTNPTVGATTGTLRQAIIDSNADTAGINTIDFNIGAGVQTITPAASLPPITQPVIVDGFSEDKSSSVPTVVLDGQNAPDRDWTSNPMLAEAPSTASS